LVEIQPPQPAPLRPFNTEAPFAKHSSLAAIINYLPLTASSSTRQTYASAVGWSRDVSAG